MDTLRLIVIAWGIKDQCPDCHIAQNFNDSWKTWVDLKVHNQLASFICRQFFIFDDLMCKAANPSMLLSVKMVLDKLSAKALCYMRYLI